MATRSVLLSFFLASIPLILCSDSVPVLFIGSKSGQLPYTAPVSAVHKISLKEFKIDYLTKVAGEKLIVLFLQDDLSLEDFSVYGNAYGKKDDSGAFKNLKALLDEKPFLLLPDVERPSKMVDLLMQQGKVQTLKERSYSLTAAGIDLSVPSLVVIHLPETKHAIDRQLALQRNDQIIQSVWDELAAKSLDFIVVYTAESSSVADSSEDHARIARRTLSIEESNSPWIIFDKNSNMTLLVTQNISFVVLSYNNVTKDDSYILEGFEAETRSPSNQSIIFTVTAKSPDPYVRSIDIIFEFVRLSEGKVGDWMLSELNLTVITANFTETMQLNIRGIWAPYGYSYACKVSKPIFNQEANSILTAGLHFDGLQIQPFLEDLTFGKPYDCVGFFTIGIWMSIFSSFILVLILAFGIHMVLSINTMDRFDDPKGKTITIAASE